MWWNCFVMKLFFICLFLRFGWLWGMSFGWVFVMGVILCWFILCGSIMNWMFVVWCFLLSVYWCCLICVFIGVSFLLCCLWSFSLSMWSWMIFLNWWWGLIFEENFVIGFLIFIFFYGSWEVIFRVLVFLWVIYMSVWRSRNKEMFY